MFGKLLLLTTFFFIFSEAKLHLKKRIIETNKEAPFSFEKLNQLQDHQEEKQFLVQFHTPEEKLNVEKLLNMKVLEYVPDNGFVVFGRASEILEKKEKLNSIKWIGHFDPDLKTLLNFKNIKPLEKNEANVILYIHTNQDSSHKFQIWKQKLTNLNSKIDFRKIKKNKFILEVLPEVAQQAMDMLKKEELVHWIEMKEEYKTNNFAAHSITQSGVPFTKKNTPIWDHGITGKDEIIGIGDTGIDWDM
jgi:hypothetical protein